MRPDLGVLRIPYGNIASTPRPGLKRSGNSIVESISIYEIFIVLYTISERCMLYLVFAIGESI